MEAHAFNPRPREAEASRSLEFKASLVYGESSRTVKASEKPCLRKKKKKKKRLTDLDELSYKSLSHS